jgi:hypothetical protein
MSRSTFSILPYINRQKVKADGTANILCRITVDGKSAAISTGISCTPQEWNAKKGEVRNARDNGRLASFLAEVKDKYNSLLPIPNREVKPACADGTAMQCGRVGGRLL